MNGIKDLTGITVVKETLRDFDPERVRRELVQNALRQNAYALTNQNNLPLELPDLYKAQITTMLKEHPDVEKAEFDKIGVHCNHLYVRVLTRHGTHNWIGVERSLTKILHDIFHVPVQFTCVECRDRT